MESLTISDKQAENGIHMGYLDIQIQVYYRWGGDNLNVFNNHMMKMVNEFECYSYYERMKKWKSICFL